MKELDALVAEGRRLSSELNGTPHQFHECARRVRQWQHECAALVSQLSAGSKAHWLSRAFSDALLVRSPSPDGDVDAPLAAIVDRIVTVLERAEAAIAEAGGLVAASAPDVASRRFDFVTDEALRPVLERAYMESRTALADGRYDETLQTSCSILEAILTDALQAKGFNVAAWPFAARIKAAERERLIRGGCARLSAAALGYRERGGAGPVATAAVTRREAVTAAQVLNVIIRDLDPGR